MHPGADNKVTKKEIFVPAGNRTPSIRIVAICFTDRGTTGLRSTGLKVIGLCFTKGFASRIYRPVNLPIIEKMQEALLNRVLYENGREYTIGRSATCRIITNCDKC
jgi:hypothetical protein